MKMTWDYVAGFFDGEGCITNFVHTTTKIVYPRIQVKQKNKKVLLEVQKFIGGYGHITFDKYGQIFHFRITKIEDEIDFLEHIKNKSIVKKDKILKALLKLKRLKANRYKRR